MKRINVFDTNSHITSIFIYLFIYKCNKFNSVPLITTHPSLCPHISIKPKFRLLLYSTQLVIFENIEDIQIRTGKLSILEYTSEQWLFEAHHTYNILEFFSCGKSILILCTMIWHICIGFKETDFYLSKYYI